jgi:MFS transporter, ACS family, D-galactonate transporter
MPTPVFLKSQTRWRIPVVLAVTIFINYLDRSNLALVIPQLAQDFGWSNREVGANGEVLLALSSCPTHFQICCSVQWRSGSEPRKV